MSSFAVLIDENRRLAMDNKELLVRLSEARENNDTLRSDAARQFKKNIHLVQATDQAKRDLEELQSTCEMYKDQCATLTQQRDRKEAELQQVWAHVDSVGSIRDVIANLRDLKSTHTDDMSLLRRRLDEKSARVSDLEHELEKLAVAHSEALSNTSPSKNTFETEAELLSLKSQITSLSQKVTSQNNALLQCNTTLARMEEALEAAEADAQKFQYKLEVLSTENQQLRDALLAAQTEITTLKDQKKLKEF
eukprot:PhM_4_TR14227/c0_g2_i1/m.66650